MKQHIEGFRKQVSLLEPPKKFSFKSRQAKTTSSGAQSVQKSTNHGLKDISNIIVHKQEQQQQEGLVGLRGQKVHKGEKDIPSAGSDYSLTDLEDCTVYLCAPISTLHIFRLRNCCIHCGPILSSVLLEDCNDCSFSFACRQVSFLSLSLMEYMYRSRSVLSFKVRIHTSKGCDFYLLVQSKPIIEQSSSLRFAPYNFSYPDLPRHIPV